MAFLLQVGYTACLSIQALFQLAKADAKVVLEPVIAHGGGAGLDSLGLNGLPLLDGVPELLILTLDCSSPGFSGVD
jgi:hypothetical protein